VEKIAVIGGLGTLSGGDLFFKLLRNKEVLRNQKNFHFIFEQQPYSQIDLPLYEEQDIKSRKFYTYSICKNFEQKGVSKILLPCFASHTFLSELQKETTVSIVNIFEALSQYLTSKLKAGSKIGILTSNYVKQSSILQNYFKAYEMLFPKHQEQLMEAIYGEYGIKNAYLDGPPLEYIHNACEELKNRGCNIILPCITEISLVVEELQSRGVSIIDVNQVYADYALNNENYKLDKAFKLGIVGGVGPSATLDFMHKIIQNTQAKKDQDHIKMVVEQNPQIPDRTAHLINHQADPTIAMFSTCKKLEAAGSDAIAIPCNTAHAFVESIQEHLSVPIVNMLSTTAEYISSTFGHAVPVGLLATSGTLQSKVYHDVLTNYGFAVITPDEYHQKYVMESIYGGCGVKAGYTSGICKDHIMKGVEYVVERGAEIIILGCTELPLLFPETTEILVKGKSIKLIDPTLVLAKKVISIADSKS